MQMKEEYDSDYSSDREYTKKERKLNDNNSNRLVKSSQLPEGKDHNLFLGNYRSDQKSSLKKKKNSPEKIENKGKLIHIRKVDLSI